MNCECGHNNGWHDRKKGGCMFRHPPKSLEGDQLGYCICTEFKARGNP